MNDSFYFNSTASLIHPSQMPVEDDADLNNYMQPLLRTTSYIHLHPPMPQSHYGIPSTPFINTSFNPTHNYNPDFSVLTPNNFLPPSATIPRSGSFGGIPPMPVPSFPLPGSVNLSPSSISESGMSLGEGAYGYGFNSGAGNLHLADIFTASLTVNLGSSQAGSSRSQYGGPILQFIDDTPVTTRVQQPPATNSTHVQHSSLREGPERVERATRKKTRLQITPYAKPGRQAPTPISPNANVLPPIKKRSKKAASTFKKEYDYTPGPRSQMRTVVCRVNSCETPCAGKEELMKHIKTVHLIDEEHNNKYQCLDDSPDKCTHIAGGKDALVQHMRSIHNVIIQKVQIPEVVSERCPWHSCTTMCTESSLQRHVSTHANITFRCPICPTTRRFARLSVYRKHFREEHLEELEAGRYWYIEEALRHIE